MKELSSIFLTIYVLLTERPSTTDPVVEYLISSPVEYPCESILIVSVAVLIPDIGDVLSLFEYPSPMFFTMILEIIFFLFADFNL